jgi:antitoxin component of MazEF toxin-antitoxin module
MPTWTVAQRFFDLLPEKVRNHLHLQIGDQVEYVLEPGHTVLIIPIDRLDEQREIMVESLVEDDERSLL